MDDVERDDPDDNQQDNCHDSHDDYDVSKLLNAHPTYEGPLDLACLQDIKRKYKALCGIG